MDRTQGASISNPRLPQQQDLQDQQGPVESAYPAESRVLTRRVLSPAEIEERRLIGTLAAHQGQASRDELLAAGYTRARVAALVADGTLEPIGVDTVRFADPLAYFPELVWTAWRLPGAIVGGLTAAIFYGLTVASPRATEVALPLSWRQAIPAEWRVRPLRVPVHLHHYGVVSVAPMAGFPTVQIPMYDRAVTVAQVLATPDHGAEALADCVMHSLGPSGALPPVIDEAVARYGVRATLEQTLRSLGLDPASPTAFAPR